MNRPGEDLAPDVARARAMAEHSWVRDAFRQHGIDFHTDFPLRGQKAPDAIFPNNIFSITPDRTGVAQLVLYPMRHESRQRERDTKLVRDLREQYQGKTIDLTHYEQEGMALEGTGALVLDHVNRIAYVNLSERADESVARRFCDIMGFSPFTYVARHHDGKPVYHTNVLQAIGSEWAVMAGDMMDDHTQREQMLEFLREGHRVVQISESQVDNFCGNILELRNAQSGKKFIAMSQRAYEHFEQDQLDILRSTVDDFIIVPLTWIEHILGGGIRCLIAEQFGDVL